MMVSPRESTLTQVFASLLYGYQLLKDRIFSPECKFSFKSSLLCEEVPIKEDKASAGVVFLCKGKPEFQLTVPSF